MKIINRHTLETKEIKNEEASEYVFTVSSEWVPYTIEELHVLLRKRDEIIDDDRKELHWHREGLKRMRDYLIEIRETTPYGLYKEQITYMLGDGN